MTLMMIINVDYKKLLCSTNLQQRVRLVFRCGTLVVLPGLRASHRSRRDGRTVSRSHRRRFLRSFFSFGQILLGFEGCDTARP